GHEVGVVDVVERVEVAPAQFDRKADQGGLVVEAHGAGRKGGRGDQAADLRRRGRSRPSTLARKRPVCECSTAASCSGVPSATMVPPRWPPSGPRSITQSAVLITSRLCSITTTVLPSSRSLCSTA